MRTHNRLFAGMLALVLALGTTFLAGCSSCSTSNTAGTEETTTTQATTTSEDAPQPKQADPLWVLAKEEYRHTGEMWGEQGIAGTTEYARDERGNIESITTAEDITTYEFDKNGNPTKVTTTANPNSTNTPEEAAEAGATEVGEVGPDLDADAMGIVDMEAEEPASVIDDPADPATQEAENSQRVAAITHEFDKEGRLKRTTVEDQSTTEYEYDDEGRVRKQTNIITTPDFDENGNESGTLTYTDTIEYNEQGFPTRETRDWGDGSPTTVTYEYELGENGLPESGTRTEESPLETTTAQLSFTYDENGNISHFEQVEDAASFAADYTWVLVEEPSEFVRMQSTLRLLS